MRSKPQSLKPSVNVAMVEAADALAGVAAIETEAWVGKGVAEAEAGRITAVLEHR